MTAEPSNQYLVLKLIEEAAEVGHTGAKTHAFGFDFLNPKTCNSNRTELSNEIGDFLGIVDMLENRGLLDMKLMRKARAAKAAKVLRWHRKSLEGQRNDKST